MSSSRRLSNFWKRKKTRERKRERKSGRKRESENHQKGAGSNFILPPSTSFLFPVKQNKQIFIKSSPVLITNICLITLLSFHFPSHCLSFHLSCFGVQLLLVPSLSVELLFILSLSVELLLIPSLSDDEYLILHSTFHNHQTCSNHIFNYSISNQLN